MELEPRRQESPNTAPAAERITSRKFVTIRHLIDTFGSREMADEWLSAFCPILGVRPVELLDHNEGRLALNRVLICISHGMIY